MRFAYADPPYPGTAHRYPEKREVDHAALVEDLFYGSGAVSKAWASFQAEPELALV